MSVLSPPSGERDPNTQVRRTPPINARRTVVTDKSTRKCTETVVSEIPHSSNMVQSSDMLLAYYRSSAIALSRERLLDDHFYHT